MLAYLFWHRPGAGADVADYDTRLISFHEGLAAAPPVGYQRSATLRVSGWPWLPAHAYEDWYLVADWTALGVLNDAAVAGQLQPAHDAAAEGAGWGAGAIYRLIHGDARVEGPAAWLEKPRGVDAGDFVAALGARTAWRRELVLGPAPEICALDGAQPAGSTRDVLWSGGAAAGG